MLVVSLLSKCFQGRSTATNAARAPTQTQATSKKSMSAGTRAENVSYSFHFKNYADFTPAVLLLEFKRLNNEFKRVQCN
jgi:hypothetical protein